MDATLALIISLSAALLAGLLSALLAVFLMKKHQGSDREAIDDLRRETETARREILAAQLSSAQSMTGALTMSQKEVFAGQDKHIADLKESVDRLVEQQENAANTLRRSVTEQLSLGREENEKKLSEIRGVVDEKLQKTLESRLASSFKQVSDRLEEVYKGLGEMQTLATGVGDLKKVLMNVKTRGNFGEYQLGAILKQLLSPEQYEENVATVPGSQNRVEYAVKLPGNRDGEPVWLPIDSKFPMDAYLALTEVQETGDEEQIRRVMREFCARIKSFAKDVSEKYISVPYTTDFAILFLPTEGLYAEVIRAGLLEELQQKYRVNIAGPTTMAALLNSLQMGFRTLAIQKRSGEVWEVLSAVRTEFEKFEKILATTQTKLNQAGRDLDLLVGTRTRAINRRLRGISTLTEEESCRVLLEEGESFADYEGTIDK
ncbi:MAG: DNA recombination protein RmuC [Clostridia bacterium]|nr:DNA recombination protein RmuC [Clostridia bacterium]